MLTNIFSYPMASWDEEFVVLRVNDIYGSGKETIVDLLSDEWRGLLNESYDVVRNSFQEQVWKIPKNTAKSSFLKKIAGTLEYNIAKYNEIPELLQYVGDRFMEKYRVKDTDLVSLDNMKENYFFRKVDGKFEECSRGYIRRGIKNI